MNNDRRQEDAEPDSLAQLKFDFEKQRFEKELDLEKQELSLKRKELELKYPEESKNKWVSPVFIGLIAAVIGIFGMRLSQG